MRLELLHSGRWETGSEKGHCESTRGNIGLGTVVGEEERSCKCGGAVGAGYVALLCFKNGWDLGEV